MNMAKQKSSYPPALLEQAMARCQEHLAAFRRQDLPLLESDRNAMIKRLNRVFDRLFAEWLKSCEAWLEWRSSNERDG